jgi:hypothetical protein
MMLGLQAGNAFAQVTGKWVKPAPFPEPAEELYGIAAGGKVYVFGGLEPGGKRAGSPTSTIRQRTKRIC